MSPIESTKVELVEQLEEQKRRVRDLEKTLAEPWLDPDDPWQFTNFLLR